RRGELRPPPPARGHGPGLRPAPDRVRRGGAADQLRGVPGAAPADPRGGGDREHRLELRARGGALAGQLRVQRGGAGLGPELSGLETVQVIQYAGRAIQLAQGLFGDGLEARFLELLGRAKSNLPEHRDGRLIYEKFVKPAVLDWEDLGAHYAVSSLFEAYPER